MIDSESNLMPSLPSSNVVTFNIILKGINLEMCKLEFADRANFCRGKIEVLIQEITKRGLKPNDITLNTIIDIMIESGNFDLAWKYFDDMENIYGVEPDIYTYSTLLKSIKNYEPDQKNIERAFEILKIVKLSKTKGIKPDEILYNCILDTCVKYGKMEQAEAVFNDMKDALIAPSKITYAIMIRGHGNDYNLKKAFEDIRDKRLEQSLDLAQTEMETLAERFVGDDLITTNQQLLKDHEEIEAQKNQCLEQLDCDIAAFTDLDHSFKVNYTQELNELSNLTQGIKDCLA